MDTPNSTLKGLSFSREQHPTDWQPQCAPAQNQRATSNSPTVPNESETHGKRQRPTSSTRGPQVSTRSHQTEPSPHRTPPPPLPAAAPTFPKTCRYSNCQNPVTRDERFSEYCGPEHMWDALHGIALYSGCEKYPRLVNSEFCGPSCERRAEQQQRQQQQEPTRKASAQELGRSQLTVTERGVPGKILIKHDTALGLGQVHPPSAPHRGNVRCPRCSTTFTARGWRGRQQSGSPVGDEPSLECPNCGFNLKP